MGETDQLPWGSVWIIDGSTRGEEKIVQKIEAHDKIDSGHQRGRDGGIRGPHHHNCRYVQGQHLHGSPASLPQSRSSTAGRSRAGLTQWSGRPWASRTT